MACDKATFASPAHISISHRFRCWLIPCSITTARTPGFGSLCAASVPAGVLLPGNIESRSQPTSKLKTHTHMHMHMHMHMHTHTHAEAGAGAGAGAGAEAGAHGRRGWGKGAMMEELVAEVEFGGGGGTTGRGGVNNM